MDLFGGAAEEKAVPGVTKDVPEAKIQRTYETYRLLGRYISSECLGTVLVVLKKVLLIFPLSFKCLKCYSISKKHRYSIVILQSFIYYPPPFSWCEGREIYDPFSFLYWFYVHILGYRSCTGRKNNAKNKSFVVAVFTRNIDQ